MIKAPPPSSLTNLLSVQTLSQSSSSQSLSATTTPFNPKSHIFLLNFLTAPPESQTLPASPPFCQVFSSLLKTTSDHVLSTKPTKLTTSQISVSSLSETLQSSQLKFQRPSSISLPLLPSVTSLFTYKFPSCPTLTAHPSFSAPAATSCHHLVPHVLSKVLTPGSS